MTMASTGQNPEKTMRSLGDIELAVLDVDNTLVHARHEQFYAQYGDCVVSAISQRFEVELDKAQSVADYYRAHYTGGEQALFLGNVGDYFPEISSRRPDVSLLYDLLCEIDPTGEFTDQSQLRASVNEVRSIGVKVVALTSSPDILASAILKESGYQVDNDFDGFVAYDRETGPPKMLRASTTFANIAREFGVDHHRVLTIGDSLIHDVLPAHELGMRARWISEARTDTYAELQAPSAVYLLRRLVQDKAAS